MEIIDKEVYFHKYCNLCKHKDVDESEDPCDECLEYFCNTYSHRPVNFEAADPNAKIPED